jgi:hypothetical protein
MAVLIISLNVVFAMIFIKSEFDYDADILS